MLLAMAPGNFMADAVEVNALLRVLRGEDSEQSLGILSTQSHMGFGNENAGISSLLKALMGNKRQPQPPRARYGSRGIRCLVRATLPSLPSAKVRASLSSSSSRDS